MGSFNERQSAPSLGPEQVQAPDPERTPPPSPADACSEAAARLKTVIKMLHDDYCQRLQPGAEHAGRAYGERQVAEGLRSIRDLLDAAAREEERRRAS